MEFLRDVGGECWASLAGITLFGNNVYCKSLGMNEKLHPELSRGTLLCGFFICFRRTWILPPFFRLLLRRFFHCSRNHHGGPRVTRGIQLIITMTPPAHWGQSGGSQTAPTYAADLYSHCDAVRSGSRMHDGSGAWRGAT